MAKRDRKPLSRVERILQGPEAQAITTYIELNPGSTIDQVAKEMQARKICSRMTTIKRIDFLLKFGVINDKRKGKYFHSLYVECDLDQGYITIKDLLDRINGLRENLDDGTLDRKRDQMFDKINLAINEYLNKINPLHKEYQRRESEYKARNLENL